MTARWPPARVGGSLLSLPQAPATVHVGAAPFKGGFLSEYYRLGRVRIKDLSALFGFLAGWFGSAPLAWPYIRAGFESGDFTSGVMRFLGVIFGAGIACGLAGLALGAVLGWLWEHVHRLRRKGLDDSGPAAAAQTATRSSDVARQRDPAVRGEPPVGSGVAISLPPGIRIGASRIDPLVYLSLVNRVVPARYDVGEVGKALERTVNVWAWDGARLIGALRVLTDGYLFAAIPDILVDPEYRGRGIESALIQHGRQLVPRTATLLWSA